MPDAKVDYALTGPNVGGTVTWLASPTLINEVVFGYARWTEDQTYPAEWLPKVQRDKLGIDLPQLYPSQNPLKFIPSTAFGSTNTAGNLALTQWEGRFPMEDTADTWSFTDNLTKVWQAPVSRPVCNSSARTTCFSSRAQAYGHKESFHRYDVFLCERAARLLQDLYGIDQPHAVFAGYVHSRMVCRGFVEDHATLDARSRRAIHGGAAAIREQQSFFFVRAIDVRSIQSTAAVSR